MNQPTPDAWPRFLTDQGAESDDEGHLQPSMYEPLPAQLEGAALMSLSHFAVLEIKGPDSEKFLQGQTSASTQHANERIAPPTVFCTPKGRAIANAQLIRPDGERYWLLLDRTLAPALETHLSKYAPFYKTELRQRDDLAVVGVAGDEARPLLNQQYATLPENAWGVRFTHAPDSNDSLAITRHPGTPSRFLMIGLAAAMVPPCRALVKPDTATLAPEALWRLMDIRAGLHWLGEGQGEAWLPQMFNWEALSGISFKKGCYTGQEVVARAHYRGQVKKRLMRFRQQTDAVPESGAEVVDSDRDRAVGEVMAAAPAESGWVELLVIVTTKDEMPPLAVDDCPLRPAPLPYALERADPELLTG